MPEILTNVWTFVYGALCVAVAVTAAVVLLRDVKDRRERAAEAQARVSELVALEAVRTKAHKHYVEEQEKAREAFGQLPVIGVDEVEDNEWYDATLVKQARAAAEGTPLDDIIVR